MLAASQLGITICSLLLGRLGEPAVAHLHRAAVRAWLGLPEAVLGAGGVRDLAGRRGRGRAHGARRDGAQEHRDRRAGAHRDAGWCRRSWLFTTVAEPGHRACSTGSPRSCCGCCGCGRATSSRPRSPPASSPTLIAESGREGLLDDARDRDRLTRTLYAADATVADVLVTRDELVSLPPQPRRRRRRAPPSPTPGSPGSRSAPPPATVGSGTCTSRTSSTSSTTPDRRRRAVPRADPRAARGADVTARLDAALAVLRRLRRPPRPGGRRRRAPPSGWSRSRT